MQRAERPVFQAGPNGCESHHGCHLPFHARVAQRRGTASRAPKGAGATPAASTILKSPKRQPSLPATLNLEPETLNSANGSQALIVKQPAFNRYNGEHYPGAPPFPGSSNSRIPGFEPGDCGATPRPGAISKRTLSAACWCNSNASGLHPEVGGA